MPIISSVCANVWFTINELSKLLLFNFCLFHFSKFQMTVVKNLSEKPFFFIMDFEGSYKFYYVTNIFDLHTFDNGTTVLLNFFEISTEMYFVSLFFLNERNITTSILTMHLKCTVVHYANLFSFLKYLNFCLDSLVV